MWNTLKPKAKVDHSNSNSTSQQRIQNIIEDSANSSVVGVNGNISNDNVVVDTVDNGGYDGGDNVCDPTTTLMTTVISDNIRSQFKEEMESLKLRYRAEALKAIAEAEQSAYEQGE